ncbi:MAG TPA: branched-chain amino acid aminotransferase [Cyclobacteriaceae bacterium]|nr:branched-chain amino acid aminotransferase [Cyclobacteriaceae bacterium]
MVATSNISIQKRNVSRINEVDFNDLPFGKEVTDHMFVADYKNGEWTNLRIVPYGNLQISPASPAIHYGQSIFEGLKAYSDGGAGDALVFRPLDNLRRLNISGERMSMPPVPEDVYMDGMRALINLDRNWIPRSEGSSLYLRPFLFSNDEYIGIRASLNWTFMIIASPVGKYYSAPVRVKIETKFTRAVAGGTGYAKAGGNYGGAIYPTKLALEQGYQQLIWTDGVEHKYVEESGTMNVMFVIDDVLVTPALSDSILAGITRDSVLQLARRRGMKVEERKVAVAELVDALAQGRVNDAFGVGTAVTIAPIELIGYEGKDYVLPPAGTRQFSTSMLKELESIRRGQAADPFNWVVKM